MNNSPAPLAPSPSPTSSTRRRADADLGCLITKQMTTAGRIEHLSAQTVFEQRLARCYQQAIAARAACEEMSELLDLSGLETMLSEGQGRSALPMARLAAKLGLGPEHVELVWSIVACSVDGRLVPHLEALGGAHARRGLSPAVYAMLARVDDDSVAQLAHWLPPRPPPLGHRPPGGA